MCDKAVDIALMHLIFSLSAIYISNNVWQSYQYLSFYNRICSWLWQSFDSWQRQSCYIRDRAVNKCFPGFTYNPDRNKTQKIYGRVNFEDRFMLLYYPDKYQTQRMCNEAVDDYLEPLKLIPMISLL